MIKMANNNNQTGANPGGNSGSGKNQGGNGQKAPGAQPTKVQQPAQQPAQQSQIKLEDLVKEEANFFAKEDKATKEVEKDFFVGYANIITQERKGNINYKKAAVELSNAVHGSYLKNFLGVDLLSVKDSDKKSNYIAAAATMTGIDSLSLEKNLLKSVNGASVDLFKDFNSTLAQSLAQFSQKATLYRIKDKTKGKEDEVAKQLVATLPKQYQSKALDLYRVDPTRVTQDVLMEVANKLSETRQYDQKLKDFTNP